jgi:hypothetical protein
MSAEQSSSFAELGVPEALVASLAGDRKSVV